MLKIEGAVSLSLIRGVAVLIDVRHHFPVADQHEIESSFNRPDGVFFSGLKKHRVGGNRCVCVWITCSFTQSLDAANL